MYCIAVQKYIYVYHFKQVPITQQYILSVISHGSLARTTHTLASGVTCIPACECRVGTYYAAKRCPGALLCASFLPLLHILHGRKESSRRCKIPSSRHTGIRARTPRVLPPSATDAGAEGQDGPQAMATRISTMLAVPWCSVAARSPPRRTGSAGQATLLRHAYPL